MPKLKELQNDFCQYLLSGEDTISDIIVNQGGIDSHSRLAIYQNAYKVRLIGCLETDFEMLGLYLGDDLFEQMSHAYVSQHPSRYTSLRQFGDALPQFLKNEPPFSDVPVLYELALFERHLMSAFDAAETESRASIQDLQSIAPEHWPTIRLKFHPSVILFNAGWNCVDIWRALKAEQTPPEATEIASYWIIWRGEDRLTQFRNITDEAALLFNAFYTDNNFADTCEFLLEHMSDERIGPFAVENLQEWLQLGIIENISY